MKADEIREVEISNYPDGEYFEVVLFLREIAAQLADLNEHLKLVDESVFGAKK